MDRFYLSHLSAAETKDIFLEDGKLLDGGKKPDSGAFFFFADCVNIRTMAFSVGKTYDICTSAESLVVCCAPHGTVLHSPSCPASEAATVM